MISFIYLLIVINVLLVEPSSIRNANHQNEFGSLLKGKSEGEAKESSGDNGLKIVSREPFIVDLEPPRGIEKFGGDQEQEKKEKPNKKLFKKRYHNLKAFKKKQRTKREADFTVGKTRKEINNTVTRRQNQRSGLLINPKKIHRSLWETRNVNLTPKPHGHESNSSKEWISGEEKNDNKLHRERLGYKASIKPFQKKIHRPSHHPPTYTSDISLSSLIHPLTTKSDKSSTKYGEKDLKQDTDRMEKKINLMKRMLRMNDSDSGTEISRKSRKIETDNSKAANKIAKMFLALSALNHGKQRSKLKSEESKSWESADEDDNPKSYNEERYKIKKWIEHMKSKRSSKVCTCTDDEGEGHELFPLERALPKENGEDSLEECKRKIAETRNPSLRRKLERLENQKYKNYKSDDDLDSKIKALTARGRRKLELPLDDLEVYRSRAKQILQNAEEILDKLNRQEEEKRYSNPAFLMNRVKELTSRIHGDPRNSENDLIKMIQKNMDWSPLFRVRDENEKKDLSKSLKSYFVDPYEKARALTEESAKKLSAYLLKNLAMLGNEDKEKEEEGSKMVGSKDEEGSKMVGRKEEEGSKMVGRKEEGSKMGERKEEAPQIQEAQESRAAGALPTGDLENCENSGDELNTEGGSPQLKLVSNHPLAPTASPKLGENNLENSKELVGLKWRRKGFVRAEHPHPRETMEDEEKLKDVAAVEEIKNPDDVKLAMDWLSSNLKDDKSEISKQDNAGSAGEYVKDEANADKNFSENLEAPLQDDMRLGSDPSAKLELPEEGHSERNTMLQKNKELMNQDYPEEGFVVQKLKGKEFVDNPEMLPNEKNPTDAEKATDLVEIRKEISSKDDESMPKSENGAEDMGKQYETNDNLEKAREGIDTLEKNHEIGFKDEETKIEKDNQEYVKAQEQDWANQNKDVSDVEIEDGLLAKDQERGLDEQNLKGDASVLNDDVRQPKLFQEIKKPLKNIEESSKDIQMYQGKDSTADEPKGENLLGVMENQKQADNLEENPEGIENLKMSTDSKNQMEAEKQQENSDSSDNLKMADNDELNERDEHAILTETDEDADKINSENSSDKVSLQQKSEGFSSEKQTDQTSGENNDKIKESEDDFLKSDREKIQEEISTSEDEERVMGADETSPETEKTEELNRNENDVLASEHLKPKEEQKAKPKNQKQQSDPTTQGKYEEDMNLKKQEEETLMTEEETKNLGSDYKNKYASSDKDSKESESQSIEEEGNDKQILELQGTPTKSIENAEDSNIKSDSKEKQGFNSSDKENNPSKYSNSQEVVEAQFGEQDADSVDTKRKQPILGSEDERTDSVAPREELLGSQERETNFAGANEQLRDYQERAPDRKDPKAELLGSQERTDSTGPREEFLGSQERRADGTEQRNEFLGSQERGSDSTAPREQFLGSQERADGTDQREEFLGSQERGANSDGPKEEFLGSQERRADRKDPREELLGSQERGTDGTDQGEEFLSSQERGADGKDPREELLGSQERRTDGTDQREEFLGSQERGADSTGPREEFLGSQERRTDGTDQREEFLGSEERRADGTDPREFLGSQERRADSKEPREELLGSQEKGTDGTDRGEEFLGSQDRGADSTDPRQELLASKEGKADGTEPREQFLGSQERGTDIARTREQLLDSQEWESESIGPRKEILGSQETGADGTEPREELLGSQERRADSKDPREELLGSQERGTEGTDQGEEFLGSQDRGADSTGPREEFLGSKEGKDSTGTREEFLGSQERGASGTMEEFLGSKEGERGSTGSREEFLGSKERGADNTGPGEELQGSQEGSDSTAPREQFLGSQERADGTDQREFLGSQERGADSTGPREEFLGSQERGEDSTGPREEFLGSQERGEDSTRPREEFLGSQERRADGTGPREQFLGSQERGTDIAGTREQLLDSQEVGSESTGPGTRKEILGSQDTGADGTEPREELLGSQEGEIGSTGPWEEFPGSRGGADSTEPKEEFLGSREERTDSTGPGGLLGSQGGSDSSEQGSNAFPTTEAVEFGRRDNVQDRKHWATQNWLHSVGSDDYENRATTEGGKDWLIKTGQPETEDRVQSENQRKDTINNSGKMERIGNESEREDSRIGEKLEGEMSEPEAEVAKLTKPQEESKEKTFETGFGEEALKKTQAEEIEDNKSLDEDERINGEDIIAAPNLEDFVDEEGKLLRKIGEEEKEIMMGRANLMNKNSEGGEKEWASHPFQDKMSNDFRDDLTGGDNPLEYYDGDQSQTSQYLGKPLKNERPTLEGNLQKFEAAPNAKNLKIPQEIEKIMKDLNDGKEKGDIESIKNLDPAKIDKFIDRIDEAKKEEEEESVDCKKECTCADQIELRSRRTGRYEIAKDFLRWLKDMKLNRVLSDD